MVRIGMIGIGNMGSSHARQLANRVVQGAELSAICGINPERLKWVN